MSQTKGNGKTKGRIFVSCPVYYFDEPDGRHSRMALMRHQSSLGWDVYYPDTRQDALIPRVRNKVLSEYMQHGPFDYLFMIDNDIVMPPWGLDRLIQRKKDICGALYRLKDYYEIKVSSMWLDNTKPNHEGLVSIRYLGGGCMLVADYVIQAMIDFYRKVPEKPTPYWPDSMEYTDEEFGSCWALFDCFVARDETHPEGKYLPEDWAFCYRARHMGFKIWADAGLPVGHLMNNVPLFLPNVSERKPTTNIKQVISRGEKEAVDAGNVHV